MTLIAPGCCRHCGCMDDHACRLPDGDACCWIDATRTVCSSPDCIMAEARRQRAARDLAPPKPRARFSGWGYGAVVETLRSERRRQGRRRKKGRAA